MVALHSSFDVQICVVTHGHLSKVKVCMRRKKHALVSSLKYRHGHFFSFSFSLLVSHLPKFEGIKGREFLKFANY